MTQAYFNRGTSTHHIIFSYTLYTSAATHPPQRALRCSLAAALSGGGGGCPRSYPVHRWRQLSVDGIHPPARSTTRARKLPPCRRGVGGLLASASTSASTCAQLREIGGRTAAGSVPGVLHWCCTIMTTIDEDGDRVRTVSPGLISLALVLVPNAMMVYTHHRGGTT